MGIQAVGVGPGDAPGRREHVDLMRSVARAASELPLALKGGTALLLCYGLDRFSEDLDFDGNKKVNLASRISRVMADLGLAGGSISAVKDTDTVQRLRVAYPSGPGFGKLKVETSYRQGFDPSETVLIDGVRTYRVARLVGMKVAAFLGRTTARDLYDLRFLAEKYRTEFAPADEGTMREALKDVDALKERFRLAFDEDDILRGAPLDEIVLDLADRFGT